MMIRRQGEWLSAKVGEELVMMSAEQGEYVGMTEVGARVWELIESPQELEALCDKLREEFEVSPETCRTDVEAVLKELVNRRRHNSYPFDAHDWHKRAAEGHRE